jgi:hypothetical protein
MTLEYADEKLRTGVSSLADGAGRIRERLVNAWLSSIDRVKPDEDLPEGEMREEYIALSELMAAQSGPDGRGGYQASVDAMSEDEAVDVARRIVALAFSVERALYKP